MRERAPNGGGLEPHETHCHAQRFKRSRRTHARWTTAGGRSTELYNVSCCIVCLRRMVHALHGMLYRVRCMIRRMRRWVHVCLHHRFAALMNCSIVTLESSESLHMRIMSSTTT